MGRLDALRAEFVREARENDSSAGTDTIDRVAGLVGVCLPVPGSRPWFV